MNFLYRIIVLVVLGFPLLIPLTGAWLCFREVFEVALRTKKHMPITRFDSHLPLRGRWLGYVGTLLLALLGIALLCPPVFFAWIVLFGI